MRLLVINASHRGQRGTTARLIQRLVDGCTRGSGQTEVVTLAALKINRCLACGQCQKPGAGFLQCVYHARDDFAAVADQMRAADCLVFATPIHLMTMTSLLKIFLERLYSTMNIADAQLSHTGLIHHHVDAAASSKPFVTLVDYANFEEDSARNVTDYFRIYAHFMNAPQVGQLVRNAVPLLDSAEPAYQARSAAVLVAYEQAGYELATGGRIRPATQRAANQELVPLPGFRWLRRLPPIKRRIIQQMKQMDSSTP